MTKLWQELDLFTNDDILYRKLVESDRIYDFHAALNKGWMMPLPQIEEIFAEVWREECRRRVMFGSSTIQH